MKESRFKPLAKGFFKKNGFEVREIETKTESKTPDFEVIGKSSKYTVELKIKGDDLIEIKKDEEALKRGMQIVKEVITV